MVNTYPDCGNCGNDLLPNEPGGLNSKYCSTECSNEFSWRGKPPVFCKYCNLRVQTRRDSAFCGFCSDECRDRFRTRNNAPLSKTFPDGLCAGTKGAIGELIVSSDLLLKGIEVFRALSPSCSCDLVIRHKDEFHGIEVRSGAPNKSGKIYWHKKNLRAPIAAIVFGDKKEIIYHMNKRELTYLYPLFGQSGPNLKLSPSPEPN